MVHEWNLLEVLNGYLDQVRFDVEEPVADAALAQVVDHGRAPLLGVHEVKVTQYRNEAFEEIGVADAVLERVRPSDVLDIMQDLEHLVVKTLVARRSPVLLD